MTDRTVILVFSYGTTLEDWRRLGLLERQAALLDALRERFSRVVLMTYGGPADAAISAGPRVEVCTRPRWCPRPLYAVLAPWLHRRVYRSARVCYAQQLSAAITVAAGKLMFGTPFVVRCGFPWRAFARHLRRWDLWAVSWIAEQVTCRMADGIIQTADYGLRSRGSVIIPNGVDLQRFAPSAGRCPGLICWTGRMAEQKNLELLLRAVAGLPGIRLRLIGDGPYRQQLVTLAQSLEVDVEWIGRVPNDELPRHLQEASLFVFPSRYEGDPKALLEAMACALPVIASDIPEHRSIIRPGENGLLSPLKAEALRRHIQQILGEPLLGDRLGQAARRWVEDHRELGRALRQECQTLMEVMK